MKKVDGHKCWEVERLFKEIVTELKKCKEIGKIPVSMAIDTWGVDYVLLDRDGDVLGKTYGYRDDKTRKITGLLKKQDIIDSRQGIGGFTLLVEPEKLSLLRIY